MVDENSRAGSCSAGGSHVKRPRLFFSEEQKDVLRAAYDADPYPSQTSIDQLAALLGVGPKTVINWFHNHRMRGKNRSHNGGALSPSASSPGTSITGGNNGRHMKMELSEADQSSRSCDSASAEFGRYRVSQWFPESVSVGNNSEWGLGGKGGSNWLADVGGETNVAVSLDEYPEKCARDEPVVCFDETSAEKCATLDQQYPSTSSQVDDANDDETKEGMNEGDGGDEESCSGGGGMRLMTKGINKRKRACPQRLRVPSDNLLNNKTIPVETGIRGSERCISESRLKSGEDGMQSSEKIIVNDGRIP